MDPSNTHQHQIMNTHLLEDVLGCSSKPQQEKKPRPQPEQALRCPRCDSTNTKFCYYNNYSLSQPRYFCKACRRYWTKGGTLRNVPVGGGCRKNKRSSSSSSSSKRSQDHQALITTTNSNPVPTLPSLAYDSNDLTLAFARLHKQPILGNPNNTFDILGNPNFITTNHGFLDALRSGYLDTSSNGYPNFYHGFGNGNMGDHQVERGGGGGSEEMVLPYEDMSGGGGGATPPTTAASTVTTIKQELCKGRDGGDHQNGVLWGFPWQVGGDGNMGGGGVDAGRECWSGIGPSCHGLLNSPLM